MDCVSLCYVLKIHCNRSLYHRRIVNNVTLHQGSENAWLRENEQVWRPIGLKSVVRKNIITIFIIGILIVIELNCRWTNMDTKGNMIHWTVNMRELWKRQTQVARNEWHCIVFIIDAYKFTWTFQLYMYKGLSMLRNLRITFINNLWWHRIHWIECKRWMSIELQLCYYGLLRLVFICSYCINGTVWKIWQAFLATRRSFR